MVQDGPQVAHVQERLIEQFTAVVLDEVRHLTDISPALRMLRAVKSPYEIDIIAQAADRSDQVAAHAAQIIRAGMTELELAGLVEGHARKLGHQGIIRMRIWGAELFYGHLMAGASAAVPSYLASPTGGGAANPAVAQGAGFAPIIAHQPIHRKAPLEAHIIDIVGHA